MSLVLVRFQRLKDGLIRRSIYSYPLTTMWTAPGVLADADDTAKTIICLNLMGRDAECDQLIEAFEEEDYFKT